RVDGTNNLPRGTDYLSAGHPTVVVDGMVAHHLEVLRLVLRRSALVFLVKGVGDAHALDGRLLDPINVFRRSNTCCFENCRHDVNDMHKLVANTAKVLDVTRP